MRPPALTQHLSDLSPVWENRSNSVPWSRVLSRVLQTLLQSSWG